jgi:2-C-methyl-D-erythritol 4-phosphate cytidylyltransferase
MGLPGAGKSTLARALCRRLGYARVDRDALRLVLFPRPCYSAKEKAAVNAAVWRAAGERLRARRSVVLDGMSFASRADRRAARALARRAGARCVEVLVDCPVALAQRRVARGGPHPAGDRDAALVAAVAARFAPAGPRALRVDARAGRARQLGRVLRALRG